MTKKMLVLFTSALCAGSLVITGVLSGGNAINNALKNVRADGGSYTLTIDSSLYEGDGESGVGYTTVKTTSGNDIKLKYNKLSPFASYDPSNVYNTGFNSLKPGSYIEIVKNDLDPSNDGLAGISKISFKTAVNAASAKLKAYFGWYNGVLLDYEEITVNPFYDDQIYEINLPLNPSYVRIEADYYMPSSPDDFVIGLNEIAFTYSCSKTESPYTIDGDFVLNNLTDHYEVTRYLGSSTTISDISTEFNGLPITAIADNFKVDIGVDSIVRVILPSSINHIGNRAFFRATNLYAINLENVDYIGEDAFYYCSSLDSININHVSFLGSGAFDRASLYNLTISFDSASLEIGSDCFDYTSIKRVSFDSATNIDTLNGNFRKCTSLSYIELPVSLTYIGGLTFEQCSSLNTVKYQGTTEQWSHINLYSGWNSDIPATVVQCSDGNVNLD